MTTPESSQCSNCVSLTEKIDELSQIKENLLAQLIVSQDALYRSCSCQKPYLQKCTACKTRIFLPFYATQFKKLLQAVKTFEAEITKNLEETGFATANAADLVKIIRALGL